VGDVVRACMVSLLWRVSYANVIIWHIAAMLILAHMANLSIPDKTGCHSHSDVSKHVVTLILVILVV